MEVSKPKPKDGFKRKMIKVRGVFGFLVFGILDSLVKSFSSIPNIWFKINLDIATLYIICCLADWQMVMMRINEDKLQNNSARVISWPLIIFIEEAGVDLCKTQ